MFHDKSFIQALINTAKLMAVVPVITIFCSLVLAFVLNQCKLKEMVLYRTLFYFPNIVSLTVVGIIWSFVFHPNVGIVNKILGAVGLESLQRSWLGDSKTALWCIAFTLLWQAAGYYMVMHIAAMDGISPEIYESATLDGASAWRKLISITMPLMKDIIGITFVLALSGTINLSFVLSQVMTGGGPNGASSVLLQYMYTQGFVNGNFGYAMAITVFGVLHGFKDGQALCALADLHAVLLPVGFHFLIKASVVICFVHSEHLLQNRNSRLISFENQAAMCVVYSVVKTRRRMQNGGINSYRYYP